MQRLAAFLACLAFGGSALAQNSGAPPLREVERGFSVGTDFGFVDWLRLPAGGKSTGTGAVVGITLGLDAGPLRVGLVGWGQSVSPGADYDGLVGAADPRHARGDFETLFGGLDLRLRLLSFADAQDVSRTGIYVRAAFGPTASRPRGILDEQGLMGVLGMGLSYETRLRHFAVGIEALGLYHHQDLGNGAGLAVLPTLRYTF